VTVTCRSVGCGHPVEWHTGANTTNPECECCSWRKNLPNARWQTGPLGLPVVIEGNADDR